jgi:hypothetical protein
MGSDETLLERFRDWLEARRDRATQEAERGHVGTLESDGTPCRGPLTEQEIAERNAREQDDDFELGWE